MGRSGCHNLPIGRRRRHAGGRKKGRTRSGKYLWPFVIGGGFTYYSETSARHTKQTRMAAADAGAGLGMDGWKGPSMAEWHAMCVPTSRVSK